MYNSFFVIHWSLFYFRRNFNEY